MKPLGRRFLPMRKVGKMKHSAHACFVTYLVQKMGVLYSMEQKGVAIVNGWLIRVEWHLCELDFA